MPETIIDEKATTTLADVLDFDLTGHISHCVGKLRPLGSRDVTDGPKKDLDWDFDWDGYTVAEVLGIATEAAKIKLQNKLRKGWADLDDLDVRSTRVKELGLKQASVSTASAASKLRSEVKAGRMTREAAMELLFPDDTDGDAEVEE